MVGVESFVANSFTVGMVGSSVLIVNSSVVASTEVFPAKSITDANTL